MAELAERQKDLSTVVKNAELAIITFTLLALAGSVVGSTLIFQSITRPLSQLKTVAEQMADGDYTIRVPNLATDEIGQLASAFNTMGSTIQNRDRSLIELNQGLEQRVQARTRELRVAVAKAQEATRVKSEFLSTMSHELRTLLNAIIGFSDMLLMGMSGPLSEKQEHKITRLKENGKRLLVLVNNMLDMTRIEAGRIELDQQPFSPAAMAKRLSEQMAVLAEQSGLNFETRIDPGLPAILVGDEERIEQVVVNLLSNAFKFTDEGLVTLDIRADNVNGNWILAVRDTGIGIPPHAKDLIFEEFRQLDGSSHRAFKGSGLGLSITRQLVHIMGGQITVDSTLGAGSTFTVMLPLRTPEEATGEYTGV